MFGKIFNFSEKKFRSIQKCFFFIWKNLKKSKNPYQIYKGKWWKLFGRIFENSRKFFKFTKNLVFLFLDRSKKYFSKKLEIFPDIKIEAKFHSGSNVSTLSLWKSLQESASKKSVFFHSKCSWEGTTLWNPLYIIMKTMWIFMLNLWGLKNSIIVFSRLVSIF